MDYEKAKEYIRKQIKYVADEFLPADEDEPLGTSVGLFEEVLDEYDEDICFQADPELLDEIDEEEDV